MNDIDDVGIDHIAAYIPNQYLSLAELAKARNAEEKKYLDGIGVQQMSIPLYADDIVSMGANAGLRLLAESGVDPQDIGMLIVGTESSVDRAKPDATHIHSLLGISESCRVFNITHACAAANYGLVTALDWICATPTRKYALIIASDIALYGVGSAGEPTQGAGAVALLISRAPRLMRIKELATYSNNVYDFWRPLGEEYPIVKGVYSVQCYLKAALNCFKKVNINIENQFVYHTPYPKLVQKIHAEICSLTNMSAEEKLSHYEKKVAPSNIFSAKIGNTYTASLWFALLGSLESDLSFLPKVENGLYLFSYGSGSGAILMEGAKNNSWEEMASKFNYNSILATRKKLSVAEYEIALKNKIDNEKTRQESGTFIYAGCENNQRKYKYIEPTK
jgi:hydroxymethylglutaryl-CoA synthase